MKKKQCFVLEISKFLCFYEIHRFWHRHRHCYIMEVKKNKKNFMVPFYGWGLTASRLEPRHGSSLLFTTKFPETPGTHFIDLGRSCSCSCAYFFLIKHTIKIRFGQKLVFSVTDMFLAQSWRLKTSSRPFYDFIKVTI